MEHTKGPWEAIECGDDFIIQPFKGRKSIADVHNHGDKGDLETQANAHLIAAAPALLEACKEQCESCRHFDSAIGINPDCEGCKTGLAITSAEGK